MKRFLVENGKRLIAWGPAMPRRNAFSIVVPSGICLQSELFNLLSRELQFPGYFGENWNAFEECLNDLSWLKKDQVSIYHQDVPFEKGSENRKSYLEIISDLCAEDRWRSPVLPRVDVYAYFPEKFSEEIKL